MERTTPTNNSILRVIGHIEFDCKDKPVANSTRSMAVEEWRSLPRVVSKILSTTGWPGAWVC
eukprot:3042736-Amphidinium_carterae.1